MTCGELWPDEKAPDGRDVTCHLEQGHGGFWHAWWHEHHVGPGEAFQDGAIHWPTTLGAAVTVGHRLTPTVVKVALPEIGPGGPVTHVLVPHPKHVMLHANRPEKPTR